ncbi:replication protein A 14 kDa subunit isoform X1 [Vulpes vulpes]|uniref:Replication protein A 14 kDa subunit isoform X1 n=1 Tax=Vulpes vulpes TaxID=9627 RepID=A0ABM5B0D8_VULVU
MQFRLLSNFVFSFKSLRHELSSIAPSRPHSSLFSSAGIHPTGKMFILSDGEGKNGTIELMEPLDEEISGIVEVVGRVTAKATIMCASYVQFKEDNHPFDLGLYNEAVKITHEFPQFFPLGVVQYD